ncbi:olfactory receptor 51E2-like isoform X2 [Brienomyrus brachyistius]|uniref:olfactory receptor 51E2-like isoform X2 n=1 Tax=Brienomyrus brachyistius TaxID=42636 RepID=UPI0020B3B406|nr:olfactory receptor 51E2-like isoform X2 [Brienomyrus brachyistius]
MVPGKRKAAVKKRPNLHHCQLKTRRMEKFSSEMFFILAGLNETRGDKNIYFGFSFVSYLCTLFVNLSLIQIISTEKILHEPMFIFLCNLCVNGIFGATGFYPKILIDLMSDSHIISYGACILQSCVVHTYILSELTNLTVMAYDRASIRSRAEQKKFMETCLPHLLTLINFILSIFFDVMYARYGSSSSLLPLRNVLSIEYLVVPPLLNPLIYGLKLKQIRRSVWRLLYRKVSVLT